MNTRYLFFLKMCFLMCVHTILLLDYSIINVDYFPSYHNCPPIECWKQVTIIASGRNIAAKTARKMNDVFGKGFP
jgi:hypothetical protein